MPYCATVVGTKLKIFFNRSLRHLIHFPDRGSSRSPSVRRLRTACQLHDLQNGLMNPFRGVLTLTLSTPPGLARAVSVTYTQSTGGESANNLKRTSPDGFWWTHSRLTAENNTPQFSTPTFDAGDNATRSINENHADNAVVGTVAATDQDGDTLTYSLDAAAQGTFTIDSSGVIRVATGVTLDHETTASYTITAQVTDGEDASGNPESPATIDDSITVTINVNDVDEPPGKVGQPTVTALREGLSVSWSAPSNTGPAVDDYDVQVRQQGTQPWTGIPHTGTATTSAFSGLTAGTVYEVQVRAATRTATAHGQTPPAAPPSPTPAPPAWCPTSQGSPTFGFALNTLDASVGFTTATTGSAYVLTSVDVVFREAPSEVTVRLATGLPGNTTQVAKLASPITLSSGRLKFTAVQDILLSRGTTYWVVVEGAAGNVAGRQGSGQGDEDAGSVTGWTIADTALRRQRASTGSWTSSTIGMRIGINGFTAANTSPSFGTGAPTSLTIAENSPGGTTVGTVAATDPEGDTLTYSLDAAADALFDIDSSGVITVQAGAQLDHESTASYMVTVSVSDGKALDGSADTAVDATRAVTINVSDVSEPPPAPPHVLADAEGETTDTKLTVSWVGPRHHRHHRRHRLRRALLRRQRPARRRRRLDRARRARRPRPLRLGHPGHRHRAHRLHHVPIPGAGHQRRRHRPMVRRCRGRHHQRQHHQDAGEQQRENEHPVRTLARGPAHFRAGAPRSELHHRELPAGIQADQREPPARARIEGNCGSGLLGDHPDGGRCRKPGTRPEHPHQSVRPGGRRGG